MADQQRLSERRGPPQSWRRASTTRSCCEQRMHAARDESRRAVTRAARRPSAMRVASICLRAVRLAWLHRSMAAASAVVAAPAQARSCRRRARRRRAGCDGRAVVAPVAAVRSSSISPRPGSPRRSRRISAAAIEVEIGGTQLERDANGRTALRIRDIVVRDADGTIVASAPKAEVGVSGSGLFTGRMRAERLSLVGAEMAVRIEPDSKVTVFAGSNKRPFVTASASSTPVITGDASPSAGAAPRCARSRRAVRRRARSTARSGVPDFAALLAWIESLDAGGLDGRDLTEIGLKRRQSHRRRSAQRQAVDVHQHQSERDAAERRRHRRRRSARRASSGPGRCARRMTPGEQGHRIVDIETQKVSGQGSDARDATGRGPVRARPAALGAHPRRHRARRHSAHGRRPRSWSRRGSSSMPTIRSRAFRSIAPRSASIGTRRARRWSCRSRSCPAAIASRLLAQFDAPREAGGTWGLKVSGGTVVLASAAPVDRNPLVLNRFLLRLRIDPEQAAHRYRAGRDRQHRISALRSPAASTIPATIRGSPSGSPAPACRLRR